MQIAIAAPAPNFFAPSRPASSVFDPIRQWASHFRLAPFETALADLDFNPYQFQIESELAPADRPN